MAALANHTRTKNGLRTPILNLNKPINADDLVKHIEAKANSQIFANCWSSTEGSGVRSRS